MRGTHYLKSWSSTHKNITLSSGEAELVAMVKATTEGIGMCQFLHDWSDEVEGTVFVDSSAALGTARRKGNGRLRHVRVGLLWIQELSEEGKIVYKKVDGKTNPADLMTKNLAGAAMEKHLGKMNVEIRSGRAATGLELI